MTESPPLTTHGSAIEGVVDGLSGCVVRGWAWYPDEAERHARIEIHAHGVLLAVGDADGTRADLAMAGKRGGNCAFSITLPAMPEPGTPLEVSASGPGGSQALAGSPLIVRPLDAQPAPSGGSADVMPIPLARVDLQGSLDECGPERIRGWARWTQGSQASPTLVLREGPREWLRFDASEWRPDLAEIHQGDGCCGFDEALPEALCDGEVHELQLCLAGADAPMVAAFRALVPSSSAHTRALRAKLPAPLRRESGDGTVTLSVVVNFYNMQREAARTLTSLTRAYQVGSDDLDYEVLCIDNGSEPPLDPDWVAGFGPEFRLVRPSRQLASPCAALNEAALAARGKYLARDDRRCPCAEPRASSAKRAAPGANMPRPWSRCVTGSSAGISAG